MLRKNAGFSLTELMTVIGILALMCGIAMPNLIGWLPKYRMGNAAPELMGAMEHARMTAVRRNVVGTDDGTLKGYGIEIIASDVVVTDNVYGDICTIAYMAPGANDTCTTTSLATAGQHTNIATATGTRTGTHARQLSQ